MSAPPRSLRRLNGPPHHPKCYGALDAAGEDGADDFALRREHGEIGVGADGDLSLAITYANHARRIQRREAHRILQLPVGELHYVADGTIERQHASGENAVEFGAIAFHLHFETSEHVTAVAHTGCADAVGDEHSGLNSLRAQEEAHHIWMHVDAVGNDLGGKARVGEHGAENAGLAMVERAHGVKGVRSMAGASGNAGFGFLARGVGMAEADADTFRARIGDHGWSVLGLGSNGHHLDVAARGLPELLEELDGGLLDVFRRMHAFFRVADERTFEMKAERDGAIAAIPRRMFAFDGVGEFLQRIDGAIDGGGDGGRAIAGDAVLGEGTLDSGERVGRGLHDVVAAVAVDVNVDEAGRENGVAEIGDPRGDGGFRVRARGDLEDASIFDSYDRVVDDFRRSKEPG